MIGLAPQESTESSLGVNTAVLAENLWLVMERIGKDAHASIRFLDGVNPNENLVWLAYGFDPQLMQFTGGWSGVTYICTLPYSYPDLQGQAEALLPVCETLNITDRARYSRNETAVLSAIRDVLAALKNNHIPVGPLIAHEYLTTKNFVYDSGSGSRALP